MQWLNGRLATLSRFLSRSGDCCLPFFRALKNPKNFQWTVECEEAFEQVKQHLANLPRLASVSSGDKLSIYLAASRHAAHIVEVITDQPLRLILSKFDVASCLLKWAVELGEFDIRYVPRTTIKAQSVADFISELTQSEDEDPEQPSEGWVLHMDGSANSKGAGAGLVLLAPNGRSFEHSLRFVFQATNNEAEYEALLAGLRLALEMQVGAIHVLTDSQLVAEHLSDGYKAQDPIMAKYMAQVKHLTTKFSHFTLSNVPRGENERADALAKLVSRSALEARPEVDELPSRAIEIAAATYDDAQFTWVQEILRFKRDGILPPDEATARRLHRTQAWYSEMGGRLYKRSFSHPLLRCLEPEEARSVLAEVHEGICEEHIGGPRKLLALRCVPPSVPWSTWPLPPSPDEPRRKPPLDLPKVLYLTPQPP
ncbi:uncharacterized protein LOC135613841 [Musa acuminata AAA Group]|uniref:uncharacterized protein LOC135613841 n=1 Tax=Musa acuminata AAA Group TaxID=214697 RepID=UPI0031DA7E01